MYDKVTIWIDRWVVGDAEFERLKWYDLGNGRFKVESISFKIRKDTISGVGSLTKWREGHNLQAITYAEAVAIIDDLCHGWLQIDPSNVRVSGLEFGATFEVSQHPSNYLDLLGELPKSKRSPITSNGVLQTLYFSSTAQKPTFYHKFYDKGAEAEKEGNFIRYELGYKTKLAQMLGVKGGVWLSTLQDAEFFRKLQNLYTSKFMSTKKMGQINNNPENIKGVTDGYNMLFGNLLGQDPTLIERHIADLKEKEAYKDPKYYTRLKSKLSETQAKWGREVGNNPDLMAELTEKIESENRRCEPL